MSTKVTVSKLPPCDFCVHVFGRPVPNLAAYDGATKRNGQWANMCEEHWGEFGNGRLGTGFGQRLVLAGA